MKHSSAEEVIRNCAGYETIGRAIVAISNLEFAHDEFNLIVHEKCPEASVKISHGRFPRHFTPKTEYMLKVLECCPMIERSVRARINDSSRVELPAQLKELYEFRKVIAHGSINLIQSEERGRIWLLERFYQPKKKHVGRISSQVGDGYLADVCFTADALTFYIHRLSDYLETHDDWISMLSEHITLGLGEGDASVISSTNEGEALND